MKLSTKTICATAALAALTLTQAQAFESEPFGYVTISCLGGSDTIVSLPLHTSTAASSAITAIDQGASQVTISVTDMTVDAYKDSHYVRFGDDSTLEGAKMTVTANSADTLTFEIPSGYSLSSASVGDSVDIIPHTTISEFFSSVDTVPDSTEVFFFDNAANGINKSSAGGYIYFAPDWYDASDFSLANSAVLFPDEALVVRVPGDAANDFDIVISGSVPMVGHSVPVVTSGVGANDNFVSPQIPAEVELSSLFSTPSDQDEILVFDNTTRAQNKSSSGGYIFFSPNWYDSATFQVVDSLKVKPWEIAVYRRSDQGGASTTVFSGRADYLN